VHLVCTGSDKLDAPTISSIRKPKKPKR